MEPLSLGWRPLARSWMNRLPNSLLAGDGRGLIEAMLEWFIDPSLEFMKANCRSMVPTRQGNLVHSCLSFVDMLMEKPANQEDASENRYLRLWLCTAFVFGVIWGLGGCLDSAGRQKFDQFLRALLAGQNESYPVPKELGSRIEFPFPESGLVYDYFYEVSWSDFALESAKIELSASIYSYFLACALFRHLCKTAQLLYFTAKFVASKVRMTETLTGIPTDNQNNSFFVRHMIHRKSFCFNDKIHWNLSSDPSPGHNLNDGMFACTPVVVYIISFVHKLDKSRGPNHSRSLDYPGSAGTQLRFGVSTKLLTEQSLRTVVTYW